MARCAMMVAAIALLTVGLIGARAEEEVDPVPLGVVFASRTIPETCVEGNTVDVVYEVVNIGTGPVFDVRVEDESLGDTKSLKIVTGDSKFDVNTLAAGESSTFEATIKCTKPGDFFLLPAGVSYFTSDGDDAEEKSGFTTVSASLEVESLEAYKKRTDLHLDVLAIFTVLASLLTAAPLVGYLSTMSKLKKIGSSKKTE